MYSAVIDIGNTRIKLGLFIGAEQHKFHVVHDFSALKQLLNRQSIDKLICSSTAHIRPEDLQYFKAFKYAIILDHTTPLPIEVHYDTPKTLGKDRIAAVVGARFMDKRKNYLVVDLGTCMTMDFIDSDGNYMGGNISPGLAMRIRAMHEYTDKLPMVEMHLPSALYGTSTITALQNGAIRGTIFEIEKFAEALSSSSRSINIILTGGDAEFLAGYLEKPIFVSPNLVLQGLNEILLYNVA